ncbi:MAG: NAD-dependent epimerase/dehydratase family protein [Bauldia sp.]|nr:NAD-dependent epimerase/dehydratase family protein [Bauldia sp.]
MTDRVLVTGARGFIAKHCIAGLLEAGYAVVGTIRRPEAADEVRRAVARRVDPGERLTFVTADLNHDAGWPAAAAGCRYVLHIASPFPLRQPKTEDEVVRPAVEGTIRVMRAATAAMVERVVLTSSAVAIASGWPDSRVYTERDWSDVSSKSISSYAKSKTLAERAAWDEAKAAGAPRLTTINPGQVFGPPLDDRFDTSGDIVRLMLRGAYPFILRFGFPIADVRDVARAHVLAMTNPAAAGQRLIVGDGFFWMEDIVRILRDRLPAHAAKLPKRRLPDFLARLAANFDPALRTVKGDLGRRWAVSGARTEAMLGFRFRSGEEALVAMAEALIAQGLR